MGYIRVNLPNTNNKWVGFELANVDTFIICIRFGLANVDTIRILTRHEHDPSTRIVTPRFSFYILMKFHFTFECISPSETIVFQNVCVHGIRYSLNKQLN